MDPKIIDKHREIYPIAIEEIKYYSSFEQILGKTKSEYSKEERKLRWEKNVSEMKDNNLSEISQIWTSAGGDGECIDCIHFNSDDGWCKLMGLPSTVNPILSFKHGMPGMACMGLSKENNGQTELDL